MPFLEIVAPKMHHRIKMLLFERLTEAFVEATGSEANIFGIHINEYDPDQVAVGGTPWSDQKTRPYVHFLLYCPRLRRQAKQKVVEQLTVAFTSSLEKPTWKPVIHICEHPYDNVGVKGKLLSDSYETCAKAAFYYDLADN